MEKKSPEEILTWLQKNTDYLEHGQDDLSGFWPHDCLTHNNGEPCIYYSVDNAECDLDCLRYRDLSLEEYVSLRIEESKDAQS